MTKVQDYLQNLGLSEVEAKVYTGLLEHGPSTVMELAKHLHMKRITVHFNVENLIQKGLIAQTKEGTRRKVFAETPDKLLSLVEDQERSILEIKKEFPNVLKEIKTIVPQYQPMSEVELSYYEGKKGVYRIYEEALSASEMRSYVNLETIASVFPENVDLFVSAQKNNNVLRVWEIVEDSVVARENTSKFAESNKYFFKFTKMKLTPADVMIFNGRVAIVTASEKPSGIIIQNDHYYRLSKEIFDFVWSVLP
jgi:sugar-specific transcriptional regulator TrmB